MNNEVHNVKPPSLSLTTLEAGQKEMLDSFFYYCLFVCLKNNSRFSRSRYLTNYSTFLQIPLWFPNNMSGLCSNWWGGNI